MTRRSLLQRLALAVFAIPGLPELARAMEPKVEEDCAVSLDLPVSCSTFRIYTRNAWTSEETEFWPTATPNIWRAANGDEIVAWVHVDKPRVKGEEE